MSATTVRVDRRKTPAGHPAALVTVDRPKALNALNRATLDQLEDAFRELEGDEELAAVVITGAGDRAFVAGADITELQGLTPERALAVSRRGQALFSRIEASSRPVIAAVNGFALGGGLELALACHIRIASPRARLGLPEVRLGVIPGYGGTQRLPRLVGRSEAIRMVLTGEPVTAALAHHFRLVDKVHDDPVEAAFALVDRVYANGPVAVRHALAAIRGSGGDMERGLALEASLFASLAGTEDMREGLAAFLEKRPPRFRGR